MPEDISFACPHCGQSLEAPPEMGGDSLACPACGKEIVVPAPETAAAEEDAAPERKKGGVCPSCGSNLPPTAVLCVNCGLNLKTGKKLGTKIG